MSPKHATAAAIAFALIMATGAWLLRSDDGGDSWGRLTVYAAASLSEPFTRIARDFEERRGVRVQIEFAGSQELRTRLLHGAPADVFASANEKEMHAVIHAGLVVGDDVRIFARNQLVMIARGDLSEPLCTPCDMARDGLAVCIADVAVPAGAYTADMLDAMRADCGPDFAERVRRNVCSYELNVKLVLAKVRLGEADAGIVYRSDALDLADPLFVIDPPADRSPVATYPIAVIAASRSADRARGFVEYVCSPEGQRVLQHHAFLPGSSE